jgi:hypothetical protein
MKLGEFFTLDEFCNSPTAVAKGIPNFPSGDNVNAMAALVKHVLDPLRRVLGRPVKITSGFRSAKLNQAIGGSSTSDHVYGFAADIKVDGMTAKQIAKVIMEQKLPFDQLIAYDPKRGGHLHVSYKSKNRQETLWASAKGGYTATSFI